MARKVGAIFARPLAALITGTVASLALSTVPVLGDIPTGLPQFIMPTFSSDTLFIVFEAAMILAALGAIDSLLTSLVADNMTRTRHNSNRELIGQGVGNTIAGFFGGIPGAGATMRTVVNIRTGGDQDFRNVAQSVVTGRCGGAGACWHQKSPMQCSRGFSSKWVTTLSMSHT